MAVMFVPEAGAQAKKGGAVKAVQEKNVNPAACYECHGTVKELHTMGKHRKVNCVSCHGDLANHLANPGKETRAGGGRSRLLVTVQQHHIFGRSAQLTYMRSAAPVRLSKSAALLNGYSPAVLVLW